MYYTDRVIIVICDHNMSQQEYVLFYNRVA